MNSLEKHLLSLISEKDQILESENPDMDRVVELQDKIYELQYSLDSEENEPYNKSKRRKR